jgi:hypothetical protein
MSAVSILNITVAILTPISMVEMLEAGITVKSGYDA